MPVAIHRIRDLIIKHLKEELTEEESQELQSWVHRSEDNALLFNQLTEPDSLEELMKESDVRTSILQKITARLAEDPQFAPLRNADIATPNPPTLETSATKIVYLTPPARRSRTWLYAAACVLLLFAGSDFWLTRHSHSDLAEHTAFPSKNDVAPGGDKAVLTLANDSTIVLENTANGNLAVQGVSRVSKDKNLLAYTAAEGSASAHAADSHVPATSLIYNTLTTPRAGQFQLILPDGSKVWLNNASSLRYPTAFTGKSREVTLNGEAYFEIAKDATKPFIVRVHTQMDELAINVLGTSFNVMAYGDEPAVRTTLLSGKVSLEGGKQSVLAPGEQAVISKEGNWRVAKGVDVEEAIAWQRGYFHFTHEDIGGVLRQLSRWYDVEAVFTIPAPDYTFDGEIDRSLSLSSILRHLEKKDLHFQIDGKKLIVSK
ncbi:MAG TPA: FecR domain-containing protein [Puia sp.]|nr:FecR domain-containing protein [Puia sp.]